ncbi:MAG: cell division protein FtsZ [Anaerolineales bacterium]|nr:cell division protein FtsZ [Anaerolineales bacterium]
MIFPNDFETPEAENESHPKTVIKVVGLGGGGSNAVNRMIELGVCGVEFIACNTDHQALNHSQAPRQVALGPRTTRGLGAGGDPAVGRAAAEESSRELAEALQRADMVFLTAGMGGGTGTGAIPVAAEIARAQGAIVVAIVTLPFSFEGKRRMQAAQEGIEAMRPFCNTLITIPNDRLLEVAPKQTTFDVALRLADDVLRQGVQAIAELITRPGLVNVDFSHVRSLMQLAGGACLAVGHGTGPDKAILAVRSALHNPMLEIGSLETAAGLLVHFTGGEDLELAELHRAMQEAAADAANAEVFFGAAIDPAMKGRVQVIIVATGVGGQPLGSVIAGASHILLKHSKPEGSPASAAAPVSRLAAEQPAAAVRRPVAQLLQPAPARTPNRSRPIVGTAAPGPAEDPGPAARPGSFPVETGTIVTEEMTPTAICSGEDLEIPAFLRRRMRPPESPTAGRSFHAAS